MDALGFKIFSGGNVEKYVDFHRMKMVSLRFKTFRGGDVDEHGDFRRLQLHPVGFTSCSQVHTIAVNWGSSLTNVNILR